jgi:hypothetical protein
MSIITFYEGRRGAAGADGSDGLGVSDVRASLIDNPVLSALHPNNGSSIGTLTSTRATMGAYKDRYGDWKLANPDTATNLVLHSTDFTNGVWADITASWSYIGTTTDPNGGSLAHEINLDVDTRNDVTYDQVISQTIAAISSGTFVMSVWMKVLSGTVDTVDFSIKDGASWNKIVTQVKPGSNWVRITGSDNDNGAAAPIISINPRGDLNARIALYACQFETGEMATPYIDNTTTATTVNYTDQARQSSQGYLIEESKDNLVANPDGGDPDNLIWTLANGTISRYEGYNAFGQGGKWIKMVFSTANTITLSVPATLNTGQTYTVSFYLLDTSSTITGVTVSARGGTPVAVDAVPTTSLDRVSVKCVAGASGSISIAMTSSAPTALVAPIVSAVRADLGTITSYYNGTRAADIYSVPSQIGSPQNPWTVNFQHYEVVNDSSIKYIFNNGLGGINAFAAYFQNNDLTVQIGAATRTFTDALTSTNISLTFDGTYIKCYADGVLIGTSTAVTPAITTAAATIYLGADSSQANSINAYLANIEFWDFEMTGNEIKYIRGSR